MSTALTDLIQHLQDFNAHHPSDESRVVVAVPTSPHALGLFEVGAVHQDAPSLVLSCRPLEEEEARTPRDGARHRQETTRPCQHNDYEDLC